jgi:hypothetical protein
MLSVIKNEVGSKSLLSPITLEYLFPDLTPNVIFLTNLIMF